MILIQNNPYRIIGLFSGATAREQERQIKRLKQFIEAEQEPQDDFSFPAFGKLNRTLHDIEEAASKLNLDSDKINAALFWFYNGNPIIDEPAFDALKEGNIDKAFKIWEKAIIGIKEGGDRLWKRVTSKNHTAFHNFFVVSFLKKNSNTSDAVTVQDAITAQIKFLESDFVLDFVTKITDITYKINKKELQLLFLNQLQSEVENSKIVTSMRLLKILKNIDFTAKEDFSKSFVQKPIEKIEKQIETTKNKRKANKANASNAGNELCNSAVIELTQLAKIIGKNDLKYSSIADKVANEILQCGIDYFNDSKEKNSDNGYVEAAIELAKLAENIAVGNLVKERIEDNITTLEEMKDIEIFKAIEVLRSIKDLYKQACRQIDERVAASLVKMKLKVANIDPYVLLKVVEMKRNALDWNKVVDLIKQAIPPQNIDKIKVINNETKINEYKSLVNFLMEKLDYWEKLKIQYLDYWSVKNTQTQQRQTTSSSSSTYKPATSSTNTYKPSTSSSKPEAESDNSSGQCWCWGIYCAIGGGMLGAKSGVIFGGLIGVIVGALIGVGIGSTFKN